MYKSFTTTLVFLMFVFSVVAQIDTVKIIDNEFVPADITVQEGDTVLWINMGSNVHTTTSGTNCMQDGTWNSGNLDPGDGFGVVFNFEGDFPYYCIPHCVVDMTGSVTVEMASAAKSVTIDQNIIHPNPARDNLWIDCSAFEVQKVNLEIINLSGQLVDRKEMIASAGLQQISISNLQRGVYIVQFKNESDVVGTQRFVKAAQ